MKATVFLGMDDLFRGMATLSPRLTVIHLKELVIQSVSKVVAQKFYALVQTKLH